MSISKKERTLSIWIGLAIGITLSSLLFRYALNEKEAKTRQRPGNFEGNTTAQGSSFDPIPEAVAKKISGGIVVFFDKNRSICESHAAEKTPKWVIETSGAFRSERLFVLIEQDPADKTSHRFFRASELYVKSAIELAWPVKPLALLRLAAKASQSSSASSVLSPERHRLIGTNERTGEWILQIKDISPSGIRSSLAEFKGLSGLIEQVRLSPW
ncbi:MAG: hypothetical protein VW622_13905, partial [Opitutae bacterium]